MDFYKPSPFVPAPTLAFMWEPEPLADLPRGDDDDGDDHCVGAGDDDDDANDDDDGVDETTLRCRNQYPSCIEGRFLFCSCLSSPSGSGGGSGLSCSSGDRLFWADSDTDPGGNLLLIFILALSTAGLLKSVFCAIEVSLDS